MRLGLVKYGRFGALLSGAAWLVLACQSASAQYPIYGGHPPTWCPPYPAPAMPTPAPLMTPAPSPGQPAAPGTTPTPSADQQAAQPTTPAEPSLDIAQAGAVGGESVAVASTNVGYIDPATVKTRFRLRYDSAWGNNRPDRAEYFYAKCGCFATLPGPLGDPNAKGPPLPETGINYQDIRSYLEVAANDRFSGFLELPVRFLNPEQNENTVGFGDMHAGLKYALISECDQVVTFQLRTYIPTGDPERGLGTNHVSLEPGLLFHQQLSDRLGVDGEFKDWIPIGGTDFAGNVLQYGLGVSYDVYQTECRRIAPVAEFVGWTVLNGKEFSPIAGPMGTIFEAGGNTIVNAKFGVRAAMDGNSLYVGYGRALTGAVWYKDIVRVEYRLDF